MNGAISSTRWHAAARTGLLATLALLGACSHVQRLKPANWHAHWPWRHAPAAAQPPIVELMVEAPEGVNGPVLMQSWERNTLRVALNSIAGEGEFKLRPIPGHDWPLRLEFAVQPGAFARLELRGEQRVILSVPAAGDPLVLHVPQGVYAPTTPALTLHYGP